jgi:hypothetical protein
MSPEDFDDGAKLDERFQWPISYTDIEPFYEAVERVMAITSGDPIPGIPPGLSAYSTRLRGAWVDLVEKMSDKGSGAGIMPMAKGRPWMAAFRATGFNSYHCLVRLLLEHPGFRLQSGAVAVQVRPPSTAGGETTVDFVDLMTRERRSLRGLAVVVAAGALDSTKLLLRSRSGDFPDGLGNSNGLLGRYLHDHARQWWPARLGKPLPLLAHPIYVARRPVNENKPLMASSLTLGMVGAAARVRAWYGGSSDRVGVQVFGTMVPSEEFTVRLADGVPAADPRDDPLEVRLHFDGVVLRNMVEARDRFVAMFARAGIDAVPEGPFHEIRPGSSFHYGGTVRMHANPKFGVLDRWNRVYDAPSVVVCDASCFPTGPEKNPTLTAMAIACRAAHRLSLDLGGSCS